jgi:2'-hydroxyisoflavone reductase
MTITRRAFLQAALASSAAGLACAGARGAGGGGAAPAASKRLSILVLGGTGFLGPAFVEAARARGHGLTLFHRGKTRPGLFPGVEEVFGDRDGKLDALRGRRWDAVLDTSGYVPRVVRQSAELLAPAVGRYLFISSISVYADLSAKRGIDEASPVAKLADPASEDVPKDYGALKAACEDVVRTACGARATVVRPGLIVGPGDPTDRFTYWPVRVARGGDVLAPGTGDDPVQVVDVRDVGAFLVRLLEAGAGGTYNATGPARPMTMREVLDACRAAAASDARLVWVPASFLEQQKIEAWSDLPAWVPAEGPESAIGRVSIAKALASGLACRPIVDTARDTLAWWRTLPEERRAKPKAGLSAEREAAALDAWRKRAG